LRADYVYQRPYKAREYAFTYEDLFQFRQVKALSWAQIARKYGCPDHTSVRYAAKRLGVPLNRPLKGPDHDPAETDPSLPQSRP